MLRAARKFRGRAVVLGCLGLTAGCATERVDVADGRLPPPGGLADSRTAAVLATTLLPTTNLIEPPKAKAVLSVPEGKTSPFDLPSAIPGSAAPPVQVPRFGKDATAADRDSEIRKIYPEVSPVVHTVPMPSSGSSQLSLGDLQQMALANSPRIRKAQAEADAAYGQVIQAGLHPNPTVGYQVDQWQPNLDVPAESKGNNSGQQGGFINLLIKTAGKLSLAQQVASYDHINALVAVRKAQVDVAAQVRTAYFAALVAQQSSEINTALANLADEVYRLQLKRVAAGVASGHEPFQFHAQAVQARNALTQAEAGYQAAWKQLAAAIGQPDLPVSTLAGRADTPAPTLDPVVVRARLIEQHTELLTARNQLAQAQTNLILQKRQPIPDLQTNTYQQYDNLARTYQFGVQIGIQLPISDHNQGNIHSAKSKIAATGEALRTTENDLLGRLGEAFGRYEANVKIARNYREQMLPDLTHAYRGVVRQYQVEPEKVGFNDIVVAQQNLGQALQSYLAAIDAQWKAVVDLAALGQLDELYPEVALPK